MIGGFIKIHRSMKTHPVVGLNQHQNLIVWLAILYGAAYQDRKILVAGKPLTLKRGQTFYTLRNLSKETGFSKKRIETVLKRFENWDMIETQKGTQGTIVTICNYNQYQDEIIKRGQIGDAKGDRKGTGRGQEGDIKEEREEYKERKEKIIADDARAREVAPINDFQMKELQEVAEPCANPISTGMLVFSTPQSWLDNGCDFQKDILPTVQALALKAPKGSISSWAYFTNAVYQAKKVRLQPPPEIGEVTQTDFNGYTRQKSEIEIAKEEGAAKIAAWEAKQKESENG